MRRVKFDAETVRHQISDATVSIGIPAYNEGDGILPTLYSLWDGLSRLHLTGNPLILSDSYDQPDLSSAQPASLWARRVGAHLEIDSNDRRRSLKEALNVLFDRAESDVLILVNADVLVPTQSLVAMLHYLFAAPRPVVAIGSTLPDPAFSGPRYRAGAWQLRAVTTAARLAPRAVGRNSFRAEGAFWGVWRTFYSTYRHPIGSGSLADDIELTRALVDGGYPCLNAAEAFVYKVPPGSLVDLCSGTVRGQIALPERTRGRNEYAAALIEAVRDPIGVVLYVLARIWCRHNRPQLLQYVSEHWRVSGTTKRRTTKD